jgi:hypothetical protein
VHGHDGGSQGKAAPKESKQGQGQDKDRENADDRGQDNKK